jgi:hypothetical protein
MLAEGEPTRRTFIKRFGQMTGMLAMSGPLLASVSSMALAQAEANWPIRARRLAKPRRWQ